MQKQETICLVIRKDQNGLLKLFNTVRNRILVPEMAMSGLLLKWGGGLFTCPEPLFILIFTLLLWCHSIPCLQGATIVEFEEYDDSIYWEKQPKRVTQCATDNIYCDFFRNFVSQSYAICIAMQEDVNDLLVWNLAKLKTNSVMFLLVEESILCAVSKFNFAAPSLHRHLAQKRLYL